MSQTEDRRESLSAQRADRRKRALKIAAAAVVTVAVLIWLAFWLFHRMTHVSANDARVATHEITVSSRLAGRVNSFSLIQGDELKANQRVAQLYSRPERLHREQLDARVKRMQSQLTTQKSRIALARSKIAGGTEQTKDSLAADRAAMHAAQANMKKAQHDARRSQTLYENNGVSESERDADRYAYQSAQSEYKRAKRQVKVDRIALANAKTGMITAFNTTVDNPKVLSNERAVMRDQLAEAQAELAHQDNQIADLAVRAPTAGVVDKTFIENGEYVSAGQPIIMMHDPHTVWIQARIKETKIHSLAIGQPVDVHVDARPDTAYHGHVQRIGDAATNQFALLPDPNPSGNFTKITQRIPVRVAIDDGPQAVLAPGMMVEVDIDVTASAQKQNPKQAERADDAGTTAQAKNTTTSFGRLVTQTNAHPDD